MGQVKKSAAAAAAAADDDVVFSSKPRREPSGGGVAKVDAAARAAPDWPCPACGASVFATRDVCYKCKEPRPKTGARPDKAPAVTSAKQTTSAKQAAAAKTTGGGDESGDLPPDAADGGGPALLVPIDSGYDLSKWTGSTPQNLLYGVPFFLNRHHAHTCRAVHASAISVIPSRDECIGRISVSPEDWMESFLLICPMAPASGVILRAHIE